ncbi:relaxase/mobilization nuclease domain-containing protein [Massilicoli timonensis]|uniref:relaxase/mobilization nuclease domain-containing protein n=1 Tax=Massilicoli timonensis TaxID=2015901 RepID=UPI00307931A7
MATTSLWHIKGRLKDLIDYVENPEKTVSKDKDLLDFYNVFAYVSRPEATENGEYVSAINCLKEIALQQMILTKKQYGKDDGYIAWHGYQSFKPDEVTPQQAHEIGLQTAKEMWGDRFQIIVTTHLDKDHLHNHFCFNSVSYIDGGKYNYSNSERQRLRDVSDRICAEHGLSVIKNPHKAPSRPVWLDEKSGKPTRYNVYREDVREAANFSRTPYYMEDYLRRKGYITDFTGKHWKIRLPQYEHFTRLDTLDEKWTPEHFQRNMGAYARYGNRRAEITYPPQMPSDLKEWFKPFQRTSHIYRLYLHYCYLLGVLPKHTEYKPTSPYLKEDLRKLDEFTAQVQYMSKYNIETFDDLYADRRTIESNMERLITARTKLQNKIRRATPAEKETLREEKFKVTEQITTLRKQLKLNKGIEERSLKIQEKTDMLYANEYRAKEEMQYKKAQRKERDAR